MFVHSSPVLLSRILRTANALQGHALSEDQNVELARIERDLDALLDAARDGTD